MGQEIELKLRLLSDQDLSSDLESFFNVESLDAQMLENTYFDSPDLVLHQSKVALRIRTKKGRYIQTLKTKGKSVDGLHQRGEWEWELPSLNLDASLLQECEGWHQDIDIKDLMPVFETNFTRRSAEFVCHNSVIELAYDRGKVTSDGRQTVIHELELELVKGEASNLLRLRDELIAKFDVVPNDVSKAEVGYELFLAHKR